MRDMEKVRADFLSYKPVAGQYLFVSKFVRNRPRDNFIAIVEKVGHKYFTLKEIHHRRFHIDGKKEDDNFNSDYVLYANEGSYEHEKQKKEIAGKIRNHVSQLNGGNLRNLNLNKLQKIAELLEIKDSL